MPRLFPFAFISATNNDSMDWYPYPRSAWRQVETQHQDSPSNATWRSTRFQVPKGFIQLARKHSRMLRPPPLLPSIYLRSHQHEPSLRTSLLQSIKRRSSLLETPPSGFYWEPEHLRKCQATRVPAESASYSTARHMRWIGREAVISTSAYYPSTVASHLP